MTTPESLGWAKASDGCEGHCGRQVGKVAPCHVVLGIDDACASQEDVTGKSGSFVAQIPSRQAI